jgi:hypothetical protein
MHPAPVLMYKAVSGQQFGPTCQRATLCIGRTACLGDAAAADIFAFCSHAPRPLTLQLHQVLFDKLHGNRLQELCHLWGAALVTLESEDDFGELP